MNWKFWLTAGEPRGRYILLMVIGVVLMMAITYPFWGAGGRGMAAFSAIAAVILSHVSAKSIMR